MMLMPSHSQPAAPRSRVKHSTTEPLHSHGSFVSYILCVGGGGVAREHGAWMLDLSFWQDLVIN